VDVRVGIARQRLLLVGTVDLDKDVGGAFSWNTL